MTMSNASSGTVPLSSGQLIKLLGAACVLAILLAGSVSVAVEALQELTPVPGNPPATDFTLTDTEGNTHNLSDYRGKVVILNFWSVWCRPCRKEMPSMQRAWEQTRDQGVLLLAVNYGDTPENVAAFFSNLKVDFPVLLGGDRAMVEQWGVKGLPTTFVIDPEGRLAYKLVGEREWDDPAVLNKVLGLKT